jgi:hypothetical protein
VNSDNIDLPAWREKVHTEVTNWETPEASSGSAGGQGSCFEFGSRGSGETLEFFVRNSNHAHMPPAERPVLGFDRDELAAFVMSAKAGQFDRLL